MVFEDDVFKPDRSRVLIKGVAATEAHLRIHEDQWRPTLKLRRELDADWQWLKDFITDELPSPDRETYALVSETGDLEGLMSLIFRADHVYVERLAVAPRNRRSGGRELRGTGALLVLHAARRAQQTGRGGRVVLHSLEDPDTLTFYRDRIQMVEVGTDPIDGQKMRRFELRSDRAAVLLAEEKQK